MPASIDDKKRRSNMLKLRRINMRSKWVRIISMALVGTMLLTGCGAAGGDKKEDSKDEKREVSDNLNKEGLPILKEKETFTIAVPQKSTLKSAAEKECVKAAEEATNVHIEWVEIPASGWKEKINIMFSTDSLPDAIIGAVDMAKNYEQLAELDEMLKEYAPNTTAFFESRDDYPTALWCNYCIFFTGTGVVSFCSETFCKRCYDWFSERLMIFHGKCIDYTCGPA